MTSNGVTTADALYHCNSYSWTSRTTCRPTESCRSVALDR